MRPKFTEMVGAVMAVVALMGVAWIAIVMANETALGGLMSILAAAAGYFLRGRVEKEKP